MHNGIEKHRNYAQRDRKTRIIHNGIEKQTAQWDRKNRNYAQWDRKKQKLCTMRFKKQNKPPPKKPEMMHNGTEKNTEIMHNGIEKHRNYARSPQCTDTRNYLVVIIGFAIRQILQSTTGILVNFCQLMTQHLNQRADAIQTPATAKQMYASACRNSQVNYATWWPICLK